MIGQQKEEENEGSKGDETEKARRNEAKTEEEKQRVGEKNNRG